ncbi:MAG: DUF933 domain-containing protein [PVC group bacterium]|nr:DUF933 domain-containing protein [PVC group bacterium]
MKIGFLGLDIEEGKVKYKDDKLNKLTEKFSPKKVSPFFVEFIKEDFVSADCLAVNKDSVLDLLILDMEKMETRLANTNDETEKKLVRKCLDSLEKEIPLCDVEFNEEESQMMRGLAPLSLKPTVLVDSDVAQTVLIEKMLQKSNTIFFYTAGPKEVHAWPAAKDTDAVTCAGKIHSDLARGFIKAEIVNFEDFIKGHNMQEAKSNGYVKLVDKDYIVQYGDILDIRFNV